MVRSRRPFVVSLACRGGIPLMRRDYQVPMVLKTLRILETFVKFQKDLSLARIAMHTKIAKASAFRILETLQSAGYVEKDLENGHYRLGMKILELGSSVDRYAELRNLGAQFLLSLRQRFNESTNLAVLDSGTVLYLAQVESSATLRITQTNGGRAPIHCTALGKALAAYTPWETIEAILRSKGMPSSTPHTITDASEFKKELKGVRKLGLAFDNEELEIASWCVAAPVFDYTGSVTCALSLAAPLARALGNEREMGAAVNATASRLSAKLGYKEQKCADSSQTCQAVAAT